MTTQEAPDATCRYCGHVIHETTNLDGDPIWLDDRKPTPFAYCPERSRSGTIRGMLPPGHEPAEAPEAPRLRGRALREAQTRA